MLNRRHFRSTKISHIILMTMFPILLYMNYAEAIANGNAEAIANGNAEAIANGNASFINNLPIASSRKGYFDNPIIAQAIRPPAFPVFKLSW